MGCVGEAHTAAGPRPGHAQKAQPSGVGVGMAAQTLGPFHQQGAILNRLVKTKLQGLFGDVEAIEISVRQHSRSAFVGLHQGVGGAGGVGLVLARPGGDHAAREGGFAHAKAAFEIKHVARPQRGPEPPAQREGGCRIGKQQFG